MTVLALGLGLGGPAPAALATTGAGHGGAGTTTTSGATTTATATSTVLGEDVDVFTPDMPQADIQARVDEIAAEQVDDEMGTGRHALLFAPGEYGSEDDPLEIQVGYYTEVAGLGTSPSDVVVHGRIDVYNRCLTSDNCTALVNFWRSLSNLTVDVVAQDGCRADTMFWAVSQAAPMRRVEVTGGNLSLMDYCTDGPQYASGGYIADSVLPDVVNGSQQQFYVHDSSVGSWSNAVWNVVFSGVEGASEQSFPDPPVTTLDTTAVSQERPYLVRKASGAFAVRVPAAGTDTSGAAWTQGGGKGRTVSLSSFLVATPDTSVRTINRALAAGRNLLLTPGVYDVASSIRVTRADTVVLGLGLPTLTSVDGAVPLVVSDVSGVDVAGLMIDAGEDGSTSLLQVGVHGGTGTARNPVAVQDVFLRVGGAHAGSVDTAVDVRSDHVLLDDLWVWRADHGTGVGWDVNESDTGVRVSGDDVTATGLFVEHFQKYNVVWSGEDGRTVFFQNELPYDAPDQASWRHGDTLGWAAYKVTDQVRRHELWGGGSYVYTDVDPTLHASSGFEVPERHGVVLHDVLTVELGAGTIDHVVNDTGDPVTDEAVGTPSYLVRYPA